MSSLGLEGRATLVAGDIPTPAELMTGILASGELSRVCFDCCKVTIVATCTGSNDSELAIVKSRVPGISAKLSRQVVNFVQALREQDFYKSPGVAETIDWATALTELDARSLTPQVVGDTLGALLKYQDDIARMQDHEP